MEIDPNCVVRNSAGFSWNEYCIRLPRGVTLDGLKDPALFKKVQASANSLRKLDKVLLVEFDESWTAEARVIQADKTKAVIGKPIVTHYEERFDRLPQTEDLRIEWGGNGFFVARKADGHRVGGPFHSLALAEKAMEQQYPRVGIVR